MNYELSHLSIGYGSKVVAGDINATLEGGKVTCLLGPNGAGKSTLLKTLCHFQPALKGELRIYEQTQEGKRNLLTNKKEQNSKIHETAPEDWSRLLGVVLTERVSVPGMKVRELVAMGRSPYTNFWGRLTQEDEKIVEDAIELTGISELAERQVATLSDGERQKVMIGKALAQQTPIILLDEPTAFLDFPSKVETMLLLSRLAHDEGKAILVSTHDLDIALQTADCLWLMGKDRSQNDNVASQHDTTMLVGAPHELAEKGFLEQFFRNANVTFDKEELRFRINL